MGGREISILGMADHARGFRRIAVAAAKITVVAPVPGTCNWVAVDEREFVLRAAAPIHEASSLSLKI